MTDFDTGFDADDLAGGPGPELATPPPPDGALGVSAPPAAPPRAGPSQVATRAEGRRRRRRRLPPVPRGVHRCMALVTGAEDTTVVDLRSGAFLRLRGAHGGPDAGGDAITAFDVVDVTWAADPQRDDPAQPEAVDVEGPPRLVGALRGRRARRVLKGLVAPPQQHLLGFAGTAAPYWEFHGMRPSVALVVPSRGPLLFRRPDGSVWARFGWPGSDHWLPVEDRRALAALWASGGQRLSGRALDSALGFRAQYLLVTLSRPRQGHCYKTVAAFLPRP